MVISDNNNNSDFPKSLAGQWGEEIRRKANLIHDSSASERFSTVAKSSFTSEPFRKAREADPNKFSKFVSFPTILWII
jgi:hypothetical protein